MWMNWLVCFFLLRQDVTAYIEIVETKGCETCVVRLTCRHSNSTIAILEASFVTNTPSTKFSPSDLTNAINHRCSGVNYCSFILAEDTPGADKWGSGYITIKYACVSDYHAVKYCNSVIQLPFSHDTDKLSDGYVHNPGYPRFYSGQKECGWKIKVLPGQNVKMTLLDFSLLADDSCLDNLTIKDSGQVIFTSCEDFNLPLTISSTTDLLEVVLSSTRVFTPRRGVLFHYTAVGCPTPQPPKDGYLVYRNATSAEYSCCVGFSFPPANERTRTINCMGHRWDAELPFPDCKNTSLADLLKNNSKLGNMLNESNTSDILVPVLILIILFAINLIVLYVIRECRRRLQEDYFDDTGVLTI